MPELVLDARQRAPELGLEPRVISEIGDRGREGVAGGGDLATSALEAGERRGDLGPQG